MICAARIVTGRVGPTAIPGINGVGVTGRPGGTGRPSKGFPVTKVTNVQAMMTSDVILVMIIPRMIVAMMLDTGCG